MVGIVGAVLCILTMLPAAECAAGNRFRVPEPLPDDRVNLPQVPRERSIHVRKEHF